jgi:hypothetical protein
MVFAMEAMVVVVVVVVRGRDDGSWSVAGAVGGRRGAAPNATTAARTDDARLADAAPWGGALTS